jgi:hypothetical protein
MVAKVNSGQNILGLLNYNENKVKEGVAECIDENLFNCNIERLSFYDKLKTFQNYTTRNHRATTNAVHVSLNFSPSEKPDKEILKEIASKYMEGIGFGRQPFLVYQHFDAAHPHIHIVTTNIKEDGKTIRLFRIGKYESEKARKQLETEYNLVRAQGRGARESEAINSINVERAVYGKSETKKAISNTVRFVTQKYKYTSIPELNAVLRQFNVTADLGKEGSQMNLKKGLLYSLIDENGKRVGVPIKASSIYRKPTLRYLEKQFSLNERLRLPHKDRLIKCIEDSFAGKKSITKAAFVKALSSESIYTVFRQNEEGRIYGVTFVDNKAKVVFNGSDLGKAYGAKALTERLSNLSSQIPIHPDAISTIPDRTEVDSEMSKVIKDLTEARQFDFSSPDSAMKRRKRKKRRGRSI